MGTTKGERRKTARRAYEHVRRHRRDKRDIHLIPDLLVAGGALYPALTTGQGGPSIGSYVNAVMRHEPTAPVSDYVANTIGNYQGDIFPVAELVIGGFVLKWVGKKTGLNKVGTKKIKVL